MRAVRDSDGFKIKAGEFVSFCYGIPPVGVRGFVIERDGKLICLTPGHKPAECNLRSLRRYVGDFYKVHS